ncbi:FOXO3 protein, partial [Polypterus senegalus]
MEEGDTLGLEAHQVDIDPDFEPQSRPRSCTWPLPRPDDFSGGEEKNAVASSGRKESGHPGEAHARGLEMNGGGEHKRLAGALPSPAAGASLDVVGQLRKAKSSRRNAWGNQSYADLITRAIESTPDKRLTLSQIYDWMVRYVPYFKDKGDSNSSAGWKPRRRAVSMDNNSKYLKSKGRASKKKAAAAVAAMQASQDPSEGSSPGSKWSPSGSGSGGGGEEFDSWTDIRSRANSSASTLSNRLSPIIANDELDEMEPEEGPSCSTSPRMYPSPSNTLSPAVSIGGHCSVELPQLTDLTGAINLNESLSNGLLEEMQQQQQQQHHQDGYHSPHQQIPPIKARSAGFSFGSKCSVAPPASAGNYCSTIYSQSSHGSLRHHSPMQTIQENKPTTFQTTPVRIPVSHYSNPASLQDLLTSTSTYRSSKDLLLSQEADSMMARPNQGVATSHSHSHSLPLPHRQSCSSGARGVNSVGLMPAYGNSLKVDSLYHPSHPSSHGHLPASTALPPNPAGLLGAPPDTCHVAAAPHPRHHPAQPYPNHGHHQALPDSMHGPYHPHPHNHHLHPHHGSYHYHNHLHHHYSYERLPPDLDLDMFHGSLDCDVESIILNDFMDSSEELDFNFDCALPQGNMAAVLGMGSLPGPPQTHNNQSWVPG